MEKEVFKELKHQGSIGDYQQQFETISSKIHGLSQQWLVHFFIAGLEDNLKCQLKLARPSSYLEAVSLARLHEPRLLALKNSGRIYGRFKEGSESTTIQETNQEKGVGHGIRVQNQEKAISHSTMVQSTVQELKIA